MEMSEMIATANAKSIEEIKSFLSKQKETYKIPYETHPADRLRQCVFAGTTNRQDFLPRDRTGNRRFIPIPVDAAQAEVHILDNEAESRAYIDQLWAEAMTIYNSGDYKLTFWDDSAYSCSVYKTFTNLPHQLSSASSGQEITKLKVVLFSFSVDRILYDF